MTVVKEKFLDSDDQNPEDSHKRRKLTESNHIKIMKGKNVYINVVDISQSGRVGKIEPFKFDRKNIKEEVKVVQNNFIEKTKKLLASSSPINEWTLKRDLFMNSSSKVNMTQSRYGQLMNSISVVYYDEKRHEIVTGHSNGSIMIWK